MNTYSADSITKQPGMGPFFGEFGGAYVPEVLVPVLQQLEVAFAEIIQLESFKSELKNLLNTYVGRPTPLTHAKRLGELLGISKLYLKREDLAHTGAHKINNAIAQVLLAKYQGKRRIVAETGAGQHGVATATACALLNMECVVFMGAKDVARQQLNVFRMQLLGATVIPVTNGSQTLKDAINEAIRYWVSHVDDTYYLLGSVVGPHPYPYMVREFQCVIGNEAREQFMQSEGKLPNYLIACVGGGSNSIGLFHPFIGEDQVRFLGVEAEGEGLQSDRHSVRLAADLPSNRLGVFQGTYSCMLQDQNGNIKETHSIAPGLDYVSVGPEHVWLKNNGLAEYIAVNDQQALDALYLLSKTEGIIPALESAHAVAGLIKIAPQLGRDDSVIVNISGRGDKDLAVVMQHFNAANSLVR